MMTLHRGVAAVFVLLTAVALVPLPLIAQAQGNGRGQDSAQSCAPGLASRDPACAPAGQAQQNGLQVGDVLNLGSIHIVTHPGLYGLGTPPAGDHYAIVNGRLIRVDGETGKVLSILRIVDRILD
ncbi:MAG: hypothetical protein Q4G14_10040 [Paracoccus sp. (in: a-proteobacteria)]|uniref:hypothetical protein n=1 Tax=Paracoccus sp. TaxID=267 RepID=UPI0026DF7313|nr:hypothetical protein [Paracoccus sp. (in: a-proteobacteria)]MDO5613565.1 hypothetical protein [Paracoccus sp. (in: a-proteobacteria)]